MERWKPITGYPGYEVSEHGKVRSFWRQRKQKGTWGGKERILSDESFLLKQSDDGNGYLKVFLQNEEKRVCKKVHRLVAEEFIDNPNNLETVDHIKPGREGKLDNSINNLRWVSRRENLQKAYRDGSYDLAIGGRSKPVMCHDTWTGLRRLYSSNNDAAYDLNVDCSTISHAKTTSDDCLVHGRYEVYPPQDDDILVFGGLYGDDVWHY